jgi:hypothetical protein
MTRPHGVGAGGGRVSGVLDKVAVT